MRRLTSVAVALALSSSPAVVSLCMTLCLDTPASASVGNVPMEDHIAPSAGNDAVAADPHAHHHAAASESATVAPAPTPAQASLARIAAGCDECCDSGAAAFTAPLGVERIASQTLAVAPVTLATTVRRTTAVFVTAVHRPLVPPPSPARAPLALRI